MGGERGRVTDQSSPPNFARWREDQQMRADTFLREMGQGIAAGLRACKVPDLLVDGWHQAWALMVADAAEDEEPVTEVVARTVQALVMARELSRTYGRE